MSGAHVRSTPVMTPTSSGTGLRRASGARQERDVSGMMELTAVRHSSKHLTRAPKWINGFTGIFTNLITKEAFFFFVLLDFTDSLKFNATSEIFHFVVYQPLMFITLPCHVWRPFFFFTLHCFDSVIFCSRKVLKSMALRYFIAHLFTNFLQCVHVLSNPIFFSLGFTTHEIQRNKYLDTLQFLTTDK